MKAKIATALIVVAGIVAATLAILQPPSQPAASTPAQVDPPAGVSESEPPPPLLAAPLSDKASVSSKTVETAPEAAVASTTLVAATTNKLERLAQIRESFRSLAGGDPTTALRMSKRLLDETEREAALLTLVTEWTQGQLGSPRARAGAILAYGLDAGLGMELVQNRELAVLWANELTAPPGRTALLWGTANATLSTDPAAAFALGDQLPPTERGKFFYSLYSGWATRDTDAALRWADQVGDPVERDKALAAIRSVAPVGIGAALGMKDGYPVIQELVPGAPSDLSGQLHPGDRIVALAQGNNSFVDLQSLSLQDVVQMVRGAPGTLVQLQVLSANAPPNSVPRKVPIYRDQIKYKPK